MFGFLRRRETRASMGVTTTQADANFLKVLGFDQWFRTSTGALVTTDAALGVPAVWAAVNFLSSTIASLPLNVYERRAGGDRHRLGSRTPLVKVLHDAANEETSAFAWRKQTMEHVLTTGRGISFIERNNAGRVTHLWALDPSRVTVKRQNRRTVYEFKDGQTVKKYAADEILDLPFMLKADGLNHFGPIQSCRDAIGLSIALTDYASKYFRNGGVPPFAVTGNFQSGGALERAADDLEAAVAQASAEGKLALTLPHGLEIKPLGGKPEEEQLIEAKRFAVEEIARVYGVPPTFLQDLTHGTFSNTEQQDLQFAKHTIRRWLEQIEQEMNLKFFGGSGSRYVEFNLDALLRGDFKTRQDGYATAIQHGVMTPNEARAKENRPPMEGGDKLWIQGAMAPLATHTGGGSEPHDDETE